jgi:hypothetical protein
MGTSMSALATETRKITRARPSALKNEEILKTNNLLGSYKMMCLFLYP